MCLLDHELQRALCLSIQPGNIDTVRWVKTILLHQVLTIYTVCNVEL